MKAIIDLNKILTDIDYEIDLLPYFVKLELQNVGIPVIIDPTDVRNPDFEVEERGFVLYDKRRNYDHGDHL